MRAGADLAESLMETIVHVAIVQNVAMEIPTMKWIMEMMNGMTTSIGWKIMLSISSDVDRHLLIKDNKIMRA